MLTNRARSASRRRPVLRIRCCSVILAAASGLALPAPLSADQVTTQDRVIVLKPDSRLRFGEIQCSARVTTYNYLVCFSTTGKYEVEVSSRSVLVVRARDGVIVYRSP
jgi:hypothetical protein